MSNKIQLDWLTNSSKALNHKINFVIPYDPIIAMECVNRGKSLVNEDNSLAHSVREIVDDVLGIKKAVKKVGWFKKFFLKN